MFTVKGIDVAAKAVLYDTARRQAAIRKQALAFVLSHEGTSRIKNPLQPRRNIPCLIIATMH
jgi:hypothetical protein